MGFPLPALVVVIVVSIPISLYLLFLILGATPFFQRHFLYAHKFNTLFWHDANLPEYWGFARNQATPFHIKTVDGETLFAWHVLPLPLYAKHEEKIASSRKTGFVQDVTATESFRLLKEQKNAKVVVYLHGNAGHIAQGWRPATYHALTDTSRYHVLAIDYRGFGHSTGRPSEAGLIADASAAIDWLAEAAGVSHADMVLYGHSLGTAVAAGAAAHYMASGTDFAGLVLAAPFTNLPSMLAGYRVGGVVPVLAPFGLSAPVLRWIQGFIRDRWPTADRLAGMVRTAMDARRRHGGGSSSRRLRLSLVHAVDDLDIPCRESRDLFRALADATMDEPLDDASYESWRDARTQKRGKKGFVTMWKAEPNVVLRHEQFPHGGHNPVSTYAPFLMAVMASFEDY